MVSEGVGGGGLERATSRGVYVPLKALFLVFMTFRCGDVNDFTKKLYVVT